MNGAEQIYPATCSWPSHRLNDFFCFILFVAPFHNSYKLITLICFVFKAEGSSDQTALPVPTDFLIHRV